MKTQKRTGQVRYRSVKKPRVVNGLDVERMKQPYDPWKSIYQEKFNTTKNKKQITDDFSEVLSVKSIQIQPKNELKKNGEGKKTVQFKNVKSGYIDSIDQLDQDNKENIKNKSQAVNEVDPLSQSIAKVNKMKQYELKNTTLDQNNQFGCKETWVDPQDAFEAPAYSRIVTNPKTDQFLQKNLKTLIHQKNEYYPYIGGECMCGQCVCGQCKCVHFKFKKEQTSKGDFLTTHATDYIPWDGERRKQKKLNPDGIVFSHKKNFQTQNQVDFQKPKVSKEDSAQFLNLGKQNNIDPFKRKLKAPCAKQTSYDLEYPNWGQKKPEIIPGFNPKTFQSSLPFFGKPVNQEYGDFYKIQNPVNYIRKNPNHEKSENPLGPNIPQDYQTTHNNHFKGFDQDQIEPVEKRLPNDNLHPMHHPYQNMFKTTANDFDNKNAPVNCPLKKEIEKVRTLLKTFAKTNRICY